MAEQKDIETDALPATIRGPVEVLGERLESVLGENIVSMSVVGSSLTADFRAGHSDINTVVVLGEQTLDSLNAIASLGREMHKRRLAVPLLMTSSYIERSRDVFGVEFLDFQLTHETVLGDDPFASLGFAKENVRLQCERELKATLIRLRQSYTASGAKTRAVCDILISTAKGMGPLLRALLWLKDQERAAEVEATFKKAGDELDKRVEELLGRMNVPTKGDIEALSAKITALTKKVDELKRS